MQIASVVIEYSDDKLDKTFDYLYLGNENIIIKYGRFIPDQQPHYDEILGVNLASSNQGAEKIS